MHSNQNGQRGFTLPELLAFCLVVFGMIGLSLFIAHPTDYGPARRDGERWAAVALQMRMISSYVAHTGDLPLTITEEEQLIGSQEGMADLCLELVPTYADELAYDPTQGAAITDSDCAQDDALYTTGFTVVKTPDNKVTISAPAAETQDISLTKQF